MKLAPCKLSLILQRIGMGLVFCLVEYIAFYIVLVPYLRSNYPSFLFYLIYTLWCICSCIWLCSYVMVCWIDAGSMKTQKGYNKIQAPPCPKCGLPKPNRVHHCSKCDLCYVRFDHHCAIVGNCIAYNNAQPFAMFLIYGDMMLFLLSIMLISFTDKAGLAIGILVLILAFALSMFAYTTVTELLEDRTTYERLFPHLAKRGMSQSLLGKIPFLPHLPSSSALQWLGIDE